MISLMLFLHFADARRGRRSATKATPLARGQPIVRRQAAQPGEALPSLRRRRRYGHSGW
jgi:hypothetical protein